MREDNMIKCLVDSGNQVSIINKDKFELLKSEKKIELLKLPEKLRIITANGSELICLGYCKMDISIYKGDIKKQSFIVINDKYKEYEAIIGTNILEKTEYYNYLMACKLEIDRISEVYNEHLSCQEKLN